MNALERSAAARATEQDPRWLAVRARDAAADGRFWYSVSTTGVYCRPTCAARLARPEHVQFHASQQEAVQAGFRPCKRCRPDRPAAVASRPVALHYAIGASQIGCVLVAHENELVRAILLGDDAGALQNELRARFPHTLLHCDEAQTAPMLAAMMAFLAAPHASLALTLAPLGTPFQQRVWAALRAIPAGTICSYGDIARRVGAPRAVRAVAAACAANPLAVAIPCHRVLRADGGLSGYRWGIARKRALLAREARA